MRHTTDLVPGLRVGSVVDIGGGTGAATWAVAQAFPDLTTATVADGSTDALATGRRIARHGPPAVAAATWQRTHLRSDTVLPQAGLAIVSYLLGELADPLQEAVTDAAATASPTLLIIEPGTPRGYAAVLAARSRLTRAGWHVLAPCPQDGPCPIADRADRADDWCHFAVRLDRSALHRRLKGGRLGHEDEKFSYVVATRDPALRGTSSPGRVLRHPVTRKGLVQLEVCHADGSVGREIITKRSPMAYRAARDAAWGSTWPDQALDSAAVPTTVSSEDRNKE
ncbi:small ribosomal subunit Rsm22 family protein [Ornithinibacter aureus]|uniref:small ribosomal subunit Rsm22 family protein n=1 Tax=Ornithinibacter aureus TaxID=622664 RepID=UPI00135C1FCE|nr:small ribosomal subunit Rsm22 family protein [Ornithinibacter aureus]